MRQWLKTLPARIIEAIIVAGALTGLALLLGVLASSIAVWIALLGVVAAGGIAFGIGRVMGGKDDLYPVYAEHIRETLETLQKILAGQIDGVDTDDFIERGILDPARYWLSQAPKEDIRLMVACPEPPENRQFRLVWASGHSLEAREKFQLDIAGSFAGFAYTTEQTQWTNDVDKDNRWTPHPEARPSRAYGSLVSVPIRHGDTVVGVLSVLSTYKNAFNSGDLKYIEILGSLVNVAWGLADTD
jgi:GAF domain-containing protein